MIQNKTNDTRILWFRQIFVANQIKSLLRFR